MTKNLVFNLLDPNNQTPVEIVTETVEGALVKSKTGGYLLIKDSDMTELPVEYVISGGDMNAYYMQQFENKLVKVTGRIWHGKMLADKVDLKK